jgi:hypothetical protein
LKGEKQGLYCSEHKLDGMVDVQNKTCKHKDCETRPSYNLRGGKHGLYCLEHKLDGMVNVKDKTCKHKDCETRPVYNLKGEKYGLYCVKHKLEGMVNVKNKTCKHKDCETIPVYNLKGEKYGLYCLEHKLDGMINVVSKTCKHKDCETQPVYNLKGEKYGLYCLKHKLEGMVDVKSKTCKSEWCDVQVNNNKYKYEGYCLFCYMHMYPDKPVSRNYKTKEFAVVEYVKDRFPNLDWIADKKVIGGCSKRRPDLLLDLGYQVLMIEVDENQHIQYDCSCQNKRVMELSQDVGHTPIVFIRFNPDDYKKGDVKVTSCWGNDTKGICMVKKFKKSEWEKRLDTLREQIDYWINPVNKTSKTVETIQLYYDE